MTNHLRKERTLDDEFTFEFELGKAKDFGINPFDITEQSKENLRQALVDREAREYQREQGTMSDRRDRNRKLHGSETFYHLLDEMKFLHDKKSHDYASDENPFANYYFAGQLASLFRHEPKDAAFVGRLGEKLYRLANLESSEKVAQNESIEDTERDIAVIVTLWIASRRDRRNALKTRQLEQDRTASEMDKEVSANIRCSECGKLMVGRPGELIPVIRTTTGYAHPDCVNKDR